MADRNSEQGRFTVSQSQPIVASNGQSEAAPSAARECPNPPVFIPFSAENPRGPHDFPTAQGRWTKCPNIRGTYDGFDGERYGCDVCGLSYFLDYEDMK